MSESPTPEEIRLRRLRGRGSAYLGRIGGIELFLPWIDWIVTFALLFLLFGAMVVTDNELRRQDVGALAGYLGAAIMIQAALYVLGTALAAWICRLRIAALQLGPARRSGRFVTYANRGRTMTFFYPLRSLLTLVAWFACNQAWAAGGGPLFAVVGQICLLSVAFSLLPLPGSDGHRLLQSLLWWLTGSVYRAVQWAGLIALALCGLGAWYAYTVLQGPSDAGNGLIWMIAALYLGMGVLTHLGSMSYASRLKAVAQVPLEQLARPVALGAAGTLRRDYPAEAAVVLDSGSGFAGVVDDGVAAATEPIELRLLPCPGAPVAVDPRQPFPEVFLGMMDEGCDAVVLQAGGRFAALTLNDVGSFLARHDVAYDNHLGVG